MIHVQDLESPVILERTENAFKIRSGFVDDKPFERWYESPCLGKCLKQADQEWEGRKKELYGPNTFVETVRNGSGPKADKYNQEE